MEAVFGFQWIKHKFSFSFSGSPAITFLWSHYNYAPSNESHSMETTNEYRRLNSVCLNWKQPFERLNLISSAERECHFNEIESSCPSTAAILLSSLRTTNNVWPCPYHFTCLLNASGIVNVDAIQQNVLTTCVGMPLTIHEMGFPTYWVAVMTSEHVSSRTVVNTLCSRKTALSVWISWSLKYSFKPPSNLYMIHCLLFVSLNLFFFSQNSNLYCNRTCH